MRIAVLGATSNIAKDLIMSFASQTQHELVLFARRPQVVNVWLSAVGLAYRYSTAEFDAFNATSKFDAVLNFVGVGNPAQAAAMGESIFEATDKYDRMATDYIARNLSCRYVFLSSGAAYGSNFQQPSDINTSAEISINCLQPQDWYGVAKLYAECRHRALPHLPIVDIRVFNYFSRTQDLTARFLITDILRAIKSGEILETTPDNIVRDYVGPEDFFRLVSSILNKPRVNEVIDCYTLAPVDKFTLLNLMKEKFGLRYEITNSAVIHNATGLKLNYYSNNRRAEKFGYVPSKTAAQTVLDEAYIALQS